MARKNASEALKQGTQLRVEKANDFASKIKSIIEAFGAIGLTAIAKYLNEHKIEITR